MLEMLEDTHIKQHSATRDLACIKANCAFGGGALDAKGMIKARVVI